MIVPCETGRKIDGIRCRRCRYPSKGEVVVREGVRFTTPARTLVDLSGVLGMPSLRRAVERAAVLKILDLEAMVRAVDAGRGRPGIKGMKSVLGEWLTVDGSVPDVRSDFEALVLSRLLALGLPRPVCNRSLQIGEDRLIVDFLWEERRVVVETDGEQVHGNPVAFQRDRRRDQILVAAGYRVVRATWDQMQHELDGVVARIGHTLELAAARGSFVAHDDPKEPRAGGG
jgi:very-short-patch-repair endonuclease